MLKRLWKRLRAPSSMALGTLIASGMVIGATALFAAGARRVGPGGKGLAWLVQHRPDMAAEVVRGRREHNAAHGHEREADEESNVHCVLGAQRVSRAQEVPDAYGRRDGHRERQRQERQRRQLQHGEVRVQGDGAEVSRQERGDLEAPRLDEEHDGARARELPKPARQL